MRTIECLFVPVRFEGSVQIEICCWQRGSYVWFAGGNENEVVLAFLPINEHLYFVNKISGHHTTLIYHQCGPTPLYTWYVNERPFKRCERNTVLTVKGIFAMHLSCQ